MINISKYFTVYKVGGLSKAHKIISIAQRVERAPEQLLRVAFIARVTEYKDARAETQREARRLKRYLINNNIKTNQNDN